MKSQILKEVLFELPNMKYAEEKGLISIIIPIYNTLETYLRECLDSVLAQTFTNWEVILVNDGSTDNTGKIIDEYANKDSRFIAIHKHNEGTLLARKTGLENSKGEFIANLDHDDKYHPDFLKKMYAKITETNADFVYCKAEYLNNSKNDNIFNAGVPLKNYQFSDNKVDNVMAIYKYIGITLWHKLIKRSIYSHVEFPKIYYLVLGEDTLQMFQITYMSKSCAYLADSLYQLRIDSLTSSSRIKTYETGIRVLYGEIGKLKTLEKLFKKSMPNCIEQQIQYYTAAGYENYYLLNKEDRKELEDVIKLYPSLNTLKSKYVNLSLIIYLILSSKGFILPLKIRYIIFRIIKKLLKSLFPGYYKRFKCKNK